MSKQKRPTIAELEEILAKPGGKVEILPSGEVHTTYEVTDLWHPASEPPKPEDFEPTGWVQVLSKGKYPLQASMDSDWYELVRNGLTHWRKITPPK